MFIFTMNSTNKTSWEFELKHYEDFKKIENKLRDLYSTERGQPCHNLLSSEFVNWKRQVFVHLHALQTFQNMNVRELMHPLRTKDKSVLQTYENACSVEVRSHNETRKIEVLTCYLPGFHVTFVPQMHIVEIGADNLLIPAEDETSVRKRHRATYEDD